MDPPGAELAMRSIKTDQSHLAGLTKYVSFVDEAGHAMDERQRFLCLAGLLATEAAWSEFEIEWQGVCAAAGLREPFHMMDFAAQRREFAEWPEERRRELLRRLIAAIVRAKAIPVGSVVSLDDYRDLSPQEEARLKDPHFVAFQTLTYQLAAAAYDSRGPVTMVYAHHPEHSGGRGNTRQLWEAFRKGNPIVSPFMEGYECKPQAGQPGLQAADLWAYELRHHFDVIRSAGRNPRWAFEQFVKLGLNYNFMHDFITCHDKYGVSGLGQMSRATGRREIDLYRPGFVGLPPTEASDRVLALHRYAAGVLGRGDIQRGEALLKEMESRLSARKAPPSGHADHNSRA